MPSRREIIQGLTDRTGSTTWWGDAAWNIQFLWFLLAFAWLCWDHAALAVVVTVVYIAFAALPFQIARHRRWERRGRVDPRVPPRVMFGFGALALLTVIGLAFVASGAVWLFGSLCVGSLTLVAQTGYTRLGRARSAPA